MWESCTGRSRFDARPELVLPVKKVRCEHLTLNKSIMNLI